MTKKVIIIGAGYAGIEAALMLSKKNKNKEYVVTLIDRNNYHTLLTEIHKVAANQVPEEAVKIPLNQIFHNTGIHIVNDEITSFQFEENKIASSKQEYPYDFLILALGSTPNDFGIPGLKENAFTLWSIQDAVKIREHIKKCFIRASQEQDADKRRALLTFVLGGAGFTGVEMIGELAQWTKVLAKEYNVNSQEIRLILIDMQNRVLSCLDENNASHSHDYMSKKLGIQILLNTVIKEVTPEGFQTGNNFIKTKTLIWTAGVRASNDVEKMPIEKLPNNRRVKVDSSCQTEFKNVYAIGDMTAHMDDHGRPYPAMVENAIQTAHGAAVNILNSLHGKEPSKVKVTMHGTIVSVGRCFAAAVIMGISLPRYLSVMMKILINIHYLWEIIGIRGVTKFLQHEFFRQPQTNQPLE